MSSIESIASFPTQFRNPRSALRIQITGRNRTASCRMGGPGYQPGPQGNLPGGTTTTILLPLADSIRR